MHRVICVSQSAIENDDDDLAMSKMRIWAEDVNKAVLSIIRQNDQIQDHENTHFCEAEPKYLMEHLM